MTIKALEGFWWVGCLRGKKPLYVLSPAGKSRETR